MNKLNYLVAIFSIALIALTSCEKDEENLITGSIIGEWITGETKVDVTIDGVSMYDYYTNFGFPAEQAQAIVDGFTSEMTFPSSVEFKEDGTYTATLSATETDEGSWTLSDDKKTLTMDAGTEYAMEMTVKVLTDTNLEVEAVETDSYDMDEDGTNETMAITMNLKFTR
jgi:hypothetical protein